MFAALNRIVRSARLVLRLGYENFWLAVGQPRQAFRTAVRLIAEAAAAKEYALRKDVLETVKAHGNEEGNLKRASKFRSSPSPLVSIVIPVFGKLPLTIQCLASLYETCRARSDIEVIVVDDGSADGSTDTLRLLSGIKLLINKKNVGYVGSCNKGANRASGEFLVFLNNDTILLDGWLEELLATIQKHDGVGIVGCQLVYPDGVLQEAGGNVNKSLTANLIGRFGNPHHPDNSYLRQVDYCSGAALLIRKAVFAQVGMFDERFAPGYYEDVDLAFKIRQMGLATMYQPMSKVVHLEGKSSGRSPNHGMKRFQEINHGKFVNKWRESEVLHADEQKVGEVLVVDTYTPTPDRDSGSCDCVFFLECLVEMGFDVTFLPLDLAYANEYTKSLQRIGVNCRYAPFDAGVIDFLKMAGERFSLVWVNRFLVLKQVYSQIREFAPSSKIILNTSDLHFLRLNRKAEISGSDIDRAAAKATATAELPLLRAADKTVVCSEFEYRYLVDCEGVSNLVHLPLCRETCAENPGLRQRGGDIVFVGSCLHAPNVDALEFFLKQIWPLVRSEIPNSNFVIVGNKSKEYFGHFASERIQVRGYLSNLSEIFAGCRMTVAPIRYGAGVKGKILTSACFGVPFVASEVAIEGTGFRNNEHCLVADDPDAFACAIVRLYQNSDLWTRLRANALRLVENEHGRKVVSKKFAELVNEVLDRNSHGHVEN